MSARNRNRFPLLSITIVVVTVLAVLGIKAADRPNAFSAARPAAAQSPAFSADFDVREQNIAFYEARARADTLGAANYAQLAQLYFQRARETGEISDYERAETAARRSLEIRASRNRTAGVILVSSLLAVHRFPEALEAAKSLCDDLPHYPSQCAVLAEIQLEIGDYDAARSNIRTLAPHRGSLGVAPRMARWYEITGRTEDAVALLRRARAKAVTRSDLPREQVAWFHLRAADIALRNGRLRAAAITLRDGLRIEPNDPRLLSAMSRLAALRHDWGAAIEYGKRAGDQADITTLALIGDAYAALGNARAAELYYERVELEARENAEPFNRQWTLFRLDHAREVAATLALFREEIEVRHDVYGWDQLAWRCTELAITQPRVTPSGTRSAWARATVLLFHGGLIEHALGNTAGAERFLSDALALNPHFHPNFPAWARAVPDSVGAGS